MNVLKRVSIENRRENPFAKVCQEWKTWMPGTDMPKISHRISITKAWWVKVWSPPIRHIFGSFQSQSTLCWPLEFQDYIETRRNQIGCDICFASNVSHASQLDMIQFQRIWTYRKWTWAVFELFFKRAHMVDINMRISKHMDKISQFKVTNLFQASRFPIVFLRTIFL